MRIKEIMKEKKNYQASNEYHVEYNKRKYKRIEIVLDKEKDADVILYLDSKTNRAVFIKELIRKAMQNEK